MIAGIEKARTLKVVTAWRRQINSKEHRMKRKAQAFYKLRLYRNYFSQGLHHNAVMARKIKQIRISGLQRQRKKFLDIWIAAFFSIKVKYEAVVYMDRKKLHKLLKGWQRAINRDKEEQAQEEEAVEHEARTLALKSICGFKLHRKQELEKQKELQ